MRHSNAATTQKKVSDDFFQMVSQTSSLWLTKVITLWSLSEQTQENNDQLPSIADLNLGSGETPRWQLRKIL